MPENNAPPPPGHNSSAQVKAFVERLMRLEDEMKSFGTDIKELKQEAKGQGFNPKMLAAVAKLMRRDKAAVQAERDELDTYLNAFGWLD